MNTDNQTIESFINEMDAKRYALIAHSAETGEDHDQQIDTLSAGIQSLLTVNVNTLPFEFILHHLSKLGICVNVLNDDNGHWAVTGDGYQSLAGEDTPCDIETHFWVGARHWKADLREALEFFLTDNEDEDESFNGNTTISDEEINEAINEHLKDSQE